MGPILQRLLTLWDDTAPGFREERLTDKTRAALEALGYLEKAPDPELGTAPTDEVE